MAKHGGPERAGEPAERLSGWRFSASAFRAIWVSPQLGRFFTPDEDRVGTPDNVVVISDSLWRTRFAADPSVLGRTTLLDGTAAEIVGVMPPGFGVLDTRSDVRDDANALPVIVVNQAMARRFWANENPIGQRVTVTIVAGEPPRETVGVVGDTPASRWDQSPAPALYVPHLQESLRSRVPYGQSRVGMTFLLRITQPLASVVPALRRAVADVDASLPVSQIQMMQDALDQQVDTPRDSMVLLGVFGAIVLLLAALGIYGVVAYGVVQRTHEIGIRMALGAGRGRVLGLVLRQSTALTLVGLVLGIGAAAMLTKYLQTLLFNITPLDAPTFAAMPALFAVIAGLAAYLPARRATKLDPQTVLRRD